MGEKSIHIVSLDVPYPPDYGGVIDIFYRIKFLSKAGVKIHLHVFEYGRGQHRELEEFCTKVSYYKRHNSFTKQLSSLPFIVASRCNEELIENLVKDDAPILFEGLHTTYFISDPRLNGRKKIIRMHNVEHEYYSHLAKSEPKYWKKAFYLLEAGKLSRYEKIISEANVLVAISEGDYYYFHKIHNNTIHIPGSHPYTNLSCKTGKGDFILYHGNLSVPENLEAANLIVDKIAPKLDMKFVLAGKNPNPALIAKVDKIPNVELYPNPSEEAMESLIENAHIHYLPSVQNTGLKLKLLYSLFAGRFVVANTTMVDNSGLADLCLVKNSTRSTVAALKKLADSEFSTDDIEARKIGLQDFSIASLQKKWLDVLFNE